MPVSVGAGGPAPVTTPAPSSSTPPAAPSPQPRQPPSGPVTTWSGQSSFTPSPTGVTGSASGQVRRQQSLGSASGGSLPPQSNVGGPQIAQAQGPSFQAGGALFERQGSHRIGPNTTISGNFEAGSARASGQANATLTAQGLNVNANLNVAANIAAGGAQLEHRIPFTFNGQQYEARVTLSADGAVGINGNLSFNLNLGANGANVSFDANGFAGAQANLGARLQLFRNGEEVASVHAGATGTAGVEGSAQLQAGFHNGQLAFNARASAAFGLGGGAQIRGTVNTAQAANVLRDGANWALNEGATQAAQLGQNVVHTLQAGATAFQNQAQSLLQQAGQTAQTVIDHRQQIQNGIASTVPGGQQAVNLADNAATLVQQAHQQAHPIVQVVTQPAATVAGWYNWLRGRRN